MGTTQKNVFAGAGFFNALKNIFIAKAAAKSEEKAENVDDVKAHGYYRSGGYVCPSWYICREPTQTT